MVSQHYRQLEIAQTRKIERTFYHDVTMDKLFSFAERKLNKKKNIIQKSKY